MESTSCGDTMFTNLKTHFPLSISDLWDELWQIGVLGKLYPKSYAKYPVADLHISHELLPASESDFTHTSIYPTGKSVSEGAKSYPVLATIHPICS